MRNMQNHKGQVTSTPAYSDASIDTLLYMIQEEKLAGDLYQNFYEQTGLAVFNRIAKAEDRHMSALVTQAEKIGIDVDALLSLPEGKFANAELQVMYDELLATGSVSADAALEVGRLVEQADIADLDDAMISVVGTRLENVYGSLLTGSQQHFDAFDFWLSL